MIFFFKMFENDLKTSFFVFRSLYFKVEKQKGPYRMVLLLQWLIVKWFSQDFIILFMVIICRCSMFKEI